MNRSFVALLLALAACSSHSQATAPDATRADGAAPPASFLRFDRVAEVAGSDLGNVNGTVEVDDRQTARVTALVAGRVAELLVAVGDRVTEGQPLLAIDSPDVKAAQADRVRAEADLALARRGADRAERLHAAGAIAEKDYFQAHEDLRKASADFERARAALDRLGVAPGDPGSRYLLRAPFAAAVLERRAVVGMEATPDAAEPLLVLSDLSQVRVTIRLPERQLPLVHLGGSVGVHVDAYPDEFPGTVTAIGDVVDDATRTVPVRCAVPNPAARLKPAMFARVTLRAAPGATMVAVPTGALLSDGQQFRVVVRRPDGQLEVRPVNVGPEVESRVEVLSGLRVGEEIVTDGAIFAAQGLGS